MRALETSLIKKELGKYKYLLWKANGKFIKTINVDKVTFYKQKIKEFSYELKALTDGRR